MIDKQKKQHRGQHTASGDASVHGHVFRAKTVDGDVDAAASEKAVDSLA